MTPASPTHPERIGNIYIVDDEPMITASLKTMLSLETKHLIQCFNSPLEALKAAATDQPDVVISDFSMPEMDGITFLRQIRERLPDATLMLLTGYADKESAINAINTVGIYRYMEKPWDNDTLKLNIENALERTHLLSDLHQTIGQLSETQAELKQTNQQLESLVEARTQDLQATYRKLQAIIRHSADGIITLNAGMQLTSVNPQAESWIQVHLNPQETAGLLAMPLDRLLRTADGSPLIAAGTGESMRLKEVYLGNIPLEMSLSPLPEDGGYVVILRDITQRKAMDRLRDDFVSTLTHDLRTPLLAAIQTLNFFTDGTVPDVTPKQLELVTMMITSNRDMLGLVNVLLEVYKYEAGRQTLIFDQVDLVPMIRGLGQELNALALSREQTLEALLSPEHAIVWGDKQELRRVLINLIGNAIHHTPRGGHIHVSLVQENGQILIQVHDNGRGIPPEDIPHLFQRFSQGTSQKRSSGSGLGLYLSRQIVDAHQGSIQVSSMVGEGSVFSVRLPRFNPQTAGEGFAPAKQSADPLV
ncbi:MAG: ATP-binding protein [Candidatus Melainabacteria bacterium]